MMRIEELAKQIGAAVFTRGDGGSIDLGQVYAGDRVSDLLAAAGHHALLISNLASGQMIRVAELMDIPAICLVNGQQPEQDMIATAQEHGTLLMVSPAGLFETCGRVYDCLAKDTH